jgi:hypothetical protein
LIRSRSLHLRYARVRMKKEKNALISERPEVER